VKSIEDIYNTYLRISRSKKNLPYKLRKDFKNIQSEEIYPSLLRLENFFKRNQYVNLNDFFEAPFLIYEDESFFNLNFFLTQKAIKAYNIFQRKKTYLDPDSEIQLKAVSDGVFFIYQFCKTNKIKLTEYSKHKTNTMNSVFIHLKEKNISIYNCLALPNFQSSVNEQNFELLEFMLGDIVSKISIFRTKFYSSGKCKKISIDGLKIIQERLDKIIY
jgi:hypothetical protein